MTTPPVDGVGSQACGPRGLLVAAPDLAFEPDLIAALTARGSGVRVIRRCVDGLDLIAAACAGGAGIALVSAGLPRLGRDTVSRLSAAGVRVVGLVASADATAEQVLRAMDVTQVVVAGEPARVVESLKQLAANADADDGPMDPAPSFRGGPDYGLRSRQDGSLPALGTGVPSPRGSSASRRGSSADGLLHDADSSSYRDCELREEEASTGSLIAVWGTPGAPGATSVAVGLAEHSLAAGRSVFLMDADPAGGCIAVNLGMQEEASGLSIAARRADQGALDVATLCRLARTLKPRWRVLTGVESAERAAALRPAAVVTACRMARLVAQDVVVDVGSAPLSDDGHTGRLLRGLVQEADLTVVVGSCEPAGVARLVAAVDALRESGAAFEVVVTRVRTSVLGRDAAGQVREALSRHAGICDPVLVADDRGSYDDAVREGRTLGETAPRSPAFAALGALAERVQSRVRAEQ